MKHKQKGFSLIELIIVVLIIGIIATIAIPNLISARRSANEGSAISSLRVLHNAEVVYSRTAGNGFFTDHLSDLFDQQIIDQTLAGGVKSGYSFLLDSTANPTNSTFTVGAVPAVSSGILTTGTRKFCLATEGVPRSHNDQSSLGTNITNDGDCNDTNYPTILE